MRIPPGKIVAFVIVIFIYCLGMISINLTDDLKVTRNQLTRFYESELDSCVINRIDTVKYPSRGNYRIFYTDCNADFYPVLLDTNLYDAFKIHSKIFKKANSVDLKLVDNGNYYEVKIRHPDKEGDRGFGTKVILACIGVVTILILLTPNSRFERY